MKLFIVYLIMYQGNKLPPFYIGSTSLEKFNKGYSGSVSSKEYKTLWKTELRSNPHLFKRRIVSSYFTPEEAISAESRFHYVLRVNRNPLYTNKCIAGNSPRSMGFVGHGDKNPMYGKSAMKGRKHSPETKARMAEARKKYWENKSNPHIQEVVSPSLCTESQ
jgi:hypothetical protein